MILGISTQRLSRASDKITSKDETFDNARLVANDDTYDDQQQLVRK